MAFSFRTFVLSVLAVAVGLLPAQSQAGIIPSYGQPNQVVGVERIFSFSSNSSRIKNLAVRANGNILYTISAPEAAVWEIDPRIGQKSAKIVVEPAYLNQTVALGIAEVRPDIFAFASGVPFSNNTFNIHTIDFNRLGRPAVALTATIPEVTLLDGMTPLNSQDGTVLVSDAAEALIFRVNVFTGQYAVVQNDPSLGIGGPGYPLGVNGIRRLKNMLYYINSSKQGMYRVPINRDGTPAGPVELLANVGEQMPLPDDFAVSAGGTCFMAGSNEIATVRQPGNTTVILGTQSTALLSGVTSAQFGRTFFDQHTLYVTSAGVSRTNISGAPYEAPGFIDAIRLRNIT